MSRDWHQHHPLRSYERKAHKGSLVASGRCRRLGGMYACAGGYCHSASNSENSSREVYAGTLACIAHAQSSISVLYMIKYILYIYMPNAFYAKKRVFICHFGEICIYCANQSIITPVLYVPKVFPTILPTKESNEYNHTFQVKQKAPIQHHNFLKTMKSIEAGKVKKKLNCLILYSHCVILQFQPKLIYIYIYIYENQLVCYCHSFICY